MPIPVGPLFAAILIFSPLYSVVDSVDDGAVVSLFDAPVQAANAKSIIRASASAIIFFAFFISKIHLSLFSANGR